MSNGPLGAAVIHPWQAQPPRLAIKLPTRIVLIRAAKKRGDLSFKPKKSLVLF
jgi:hypothetical protein